VSPATARRLAWAVWALCMVALGVAFVLPDERGHGGVAGMVASVVFTLSFATVGAVVASRRSANPVGWLMCLSGLSYAVGGLAVTYIESIPEATEDGFLLEFADWVSSWVWMVGIGAAATFLLLLFPTGRLPSRRWRPVAWAAGWALGLTVVGIALSPDSGDLDRENPIAVPGAELVAGVGLFLLLPAALASVASLVVRYRGAPSEERRQLEWLTYAAALAGAALLILIVLESSVGTSDELSNTLVSGAVATLPVAMGIAILRHGLFDIDVVVNRTLVYAASTATLAGAYLGLVLLLQLALSPLTEESDLAVAGSTLAVAALFGPARARIQALVDRRFFRRRYDAGQTLERFGTRLRDEVDLEALGGELRAVVGETMQPAHVSLWLRAPEARR
jgi:hypothetical protein